MRMFSPVRVPVGLYRAAEYMREHGDARDVFQDSAFDRTYTVAALSERRAYVVHAMNPSRYNSALVAERADAIDALVGLRDSAAIAARARELGLRWFLLNPGDRVDWPEEITGRPAFDLVVRFGRSGPSHSDIMTNRLLGPSLIRSIAPSGTE
jgi:hypothetical protein